MLRFHRAMSAAFVLAMALTVSACSNSGHGFDPTDFISGEWFAKPPLPGERKPVFPEGVPGVPEGVPPELVKGHQQAAVETEVPPPAAKPAPARTTSQPTKPKSRTASAPTQPRPAAPRQLPAQPPSDQSAAPWPDPAAQPASPPPQNAWPPPDTNTFSR